ncbi:MAG: cysteine-rich CWC family protein [Paludibacteraceae bacterium]
MPISPCNKKCPRCGAHFTCTHDAFCQCVGVVLSDTAHAYIKSHYSDCLCRNCLLTVSRLYSDK